jgi:GT2 family glycosyltransferase/glycosyltransferase involved in cell wall biosynthesis
MSKKIDIVIPVHNSLHWVDLCLRELYKYKSTRVANIILVDDRTEPAQFQKLKNILKEFPFVKIISNDNERGGFGFSCNLGAKVCTSQLILFLNTDCLITSKVLDALANIFDHDDKVALACPFSNNSHPLTCKILPGRSYNDMADYIYKSSPASVLENFVEASVVGNCLMVDRKFFLTAEGFSNEWGSGYGEETDLHMKALGMGLKGVVHLGAYVYHFGGGTFQYQKNIDEQKKLNFSNFMKKWSKQYNVLQSRIKNRDSLNILDSNLKIFFSKNKLKEIKLDILFYLPGLDQGIGGIHTVVSLCNDLNRAGIKASIAIVGASSYMNSSNFKEPLFFEFLYFPSNFEFLNDSLILPEIVVSTIWNSANIVSEYAKTRNATNIQFVQGYEGYFENGVNYFKVLRTYQESQRIITTSKYLFEMVSRHSNINQNIVKLPLPVNTNIFFSHSGERKYDICMVFRHSPDKGQWILCEILNILISLNYNILVLYTDTYKNVIESYREKISSIEIPIDQYSIACNLRNSRIFVDTSLFEGFGLFPYQAILCGCRVVTSDSGGVRDFISHENGELINEINLPEKYVIAIKNQLKFFNNKIVSINKYYSVQDWISYFNEILVNKKVKAKIPNQKNRFFITNFTNYHSKKNLVKNTIKDLILKKIYSYLYKYIPHRVHLALKILLTGRI